jgi:hypothetical protein
MLLISGVLLQIIAFTKKIKITESILKNVKFSYDHFAMLELIGLDVHNIAGRSQYMLAQG